MRTSDYLFWGLIIAIVLGGIVSTIVTLKKQQEPETYEVSAIFIRDNCVVYRLRSNKRDLFYYADCGKN